MSHPKEKPVRVIPSKNSRHHTETRVFARNIHETWCVDKKCKFYGQPAAQGVCHTTDTFSGGVDWEYIDRVIAEGDVFVSELLASMKRRKLTDRQKIKELAVHLACTWSNSISGLDQLVRLRRDNALLQIQVGRYGKRKAK